jgi:hypothetical protein
MKNTLISLLLLFYLHGFSQISLDKKNLENLIQLSEIYSSNINFLGREDIAKKLDALRTPKLDNIINVFIAQVKGDAASILDKRFWKKPHNDDLQMWYVLREIHYNGSLKNYKSKTNVEIAQEVLNTAYDERWLLDNYYYRVHSGLSMLFNNADLSKYDINLDSLGLRNSTEKAICYFHLVEGCSQRFKVLLMLKKNPKIIEFAKKMPTINGKPYFYYKKFDYEDFKWIGYDKEENYNDRALSNLYQALMSQYIATLEIEGKKASKEIYDNSILSEPKYFKHTNAIEDLKILYKKMK